MCYTVHIVYSPSIIMLLHSLYFKTHLFWSKEKKHCASVDLHSSRFPGADIWPRLWMRPAVSVKYGSINRRSAINFNLSDLIYPIVAVGCLPLSNVLWRWAFHILYCFFSPLLLSSSSIKTRRCLVKVKKHGEGNEGIKTPMKFNPFRCHHCRAAG